MRIYTILCYMKAFGLGQCSLDFILTLPGSPKEDTKLEVTGFTTQGGGPVATALVTLARLGVKASFAGVVGNDLSSSHIIKGLNDEGINTQALIRRKGSSQVAAILVNTANGTRTILWKRPTAAPLRPRDVDARKIKNSSILLLDGLMKDASIHAATAARKHGVPVLLDAGRMRPGMTELIKLSTYVVGSEELSRELALTPVAALKRIFLVNSRLTAATITLGKKGSITLHKGMIIRTPAFKVKAIDTTGAGDVFHGAFAYGIIKGFSIKEALRFASAVAALKCLHPGGRSGIPSLLEAKKFIKKNNAKKQ